MGVGVIGTLIPEGEFMRGMNIARRRGTSIAAAALSFALIAQTAQPAQPAHALSLIHI